MKLALNDLLIRWIHPPNLSRDDGIRYYQERLLNTLLLALVFPGLLVYAASIALSIRDDLWLVVVTDTALYAYAVFLFFRKSLSYRLRAVSMVLISYLLGIVLLLATGVFAAGPAWLFAFPVMAALLLGTVPALSALVINGLTLLFLGLLIGAGELTTDAHTLHGVWEWTVLGLNFMLLNSVVALSIAVAANELQGLFAQKDGMLASLAQQKAALETSSRQLTEQMRQREAADAERSQLQEQLRQSQKMESIGTLAGGIAHDFNNILSSVIGYTELALDGVEPSSPPRKYLQEVMHASQRAAALVRQILMFSRHGEQTLKPVQLKGVVKEAMQLLRASLPTTIEIRESYEQDLGVVLADQTQIHQVVMNLCTNAKHAMEGRNGRIEVALAR
ncbi:MAG: hypothetical protein KFF50_00440, partial [Desulfatitalea sp.]|nr:hypothetical protein [Desulfatitalea sp.]